MKSSEKITETMLKRIALDYFSLCNDSVPVSPIPVKEQETTENDIKLGEELRAAIADRKTRDEMWEHIYLGVVVEKQKAAFIQGFTCALALSKEAIA